jgi:tetratricopeptide (TPR) repeat protein
MREFDMAEQLARRMVELFPGHTDVLLYAAVIAAKFQDFDAMLERYAAAHALDPQNQATVEHYAGALMRLQRRIDANVVLDEAISKWPCNEKFVRWRVENALHTGMLEDAVEVWRRLLPNCSEDVSLPRAIADLIVTASPPEQDLKVLRNFLENGHADTG